MRALPGWSKIPIVAMTANAFEEDRRACEAVGMSDFVAKPVNPGLLFSTLLKWLSAPPEPPAALQGAATPSPVTTTHRPPTPDVGMENALSRLDILPGLNLSYGLAMLRGNAEKYLNLLTQFVDVHAADMTKLGLSLAKADLIQARLMIHTLKGAAATLGLEHMALVAGRMDRDLRLQQEAVLADAAFRADMDAVKLEFTQLTAALPIKPLLAPPPAAPPLDPENQLALLAEMDTLLVLGDASALSFFEQQAAQLCAALGSNCALLAQQIKRFEFEAAHQTLQAQIKAQTR
jgi:CheY-like chemotaxis protein